jgi:hypothetical protein
MKLFFSESARSCLLAQPTNRRVKFRLWMEAGAAIEPIAEFALPDGFELGDPIFLFFIRHWSPEFAATPEQAGCSADSRVESGGGTPILGHAIAHEA